MSEDGRALRRSADAGRLEANVRALEGERHPRASPAALRRAEDWLAGSLDDAGLDIERPSFEFRGREHRNVVGRLPGTDPDRPRVLVGAHFDTAWGTPGADDNASGVAAVVEAARLLASAEAGRPATVEFAGFNLEEPQGATYGVGSRRFAERARRRGVAYAGCLVLEMVGYTDPEPDSQVVPGLLFWKRIPSAGTFLAAVADWRSRRLLSAYRTAAGAAAPDLDLVSLRTPLRGWLLPVTRLSDHRSFWDRGYPALMLTDTAFLRNPHYHRPTDRAGTLDYGFLARVTTATAAAADRLAGR